MGQKRDTKVAIYSGEDRQRILASGIVRALTALIDMHDDHVPLHVRVELRNVRSSISRLHRLPDPMGLANSSSVAQDVAEEDEEAVE